MSTPAGPEQRASGDSAIVLRPLRRMIPPESVVNREWRVMTVGEVVLEEINGLLNRREVVVGGFRAIEFNIPAGPGLSSEYDHLLFDAEGHPVKLLRVWYGDIGEILLSGRAVAMGGDYPYHVLFVNQPADHEEGRGTHVLDFSSDGIREYVQLLDGAPEHIKKAAELAQANATQANLAQTARCSDW